MDERDYSSAFGMLMTRRRALQALLYSGVAVVGADVLVACTSNSGQKSQGNATLVAGMARDFATFDPAYATTSTSIAANLLIFEGLYELTFDDRKLRPWLATGMPQKVSDLVYRVSFATDGTFHDGSPVTADDVAFSINRVVAAATNVSFYKQFIPFVESAKVVNATTIEIKLSYPTDILGQRLAIIRIVPQKIVSADVEKFGANPVGSGPYRFVSATGNDKVVLERSSGYTGHFTPYEKTVELRIITDPAARVAALRSGAVAIIEEPSDLDTASLSSQRSTKVAYKPGFLSTFLMFNASKPPFNDRRVRQALMYAIDRNALVRVALLGHGKAADSLLPKGHPDYVQPSLTYPFDPAKAKALLAEAGYPNGLKIPGRTFTAQVYLTSWNESAANLIVSNWRDIGFEIAENVGGEAIYTKIVDATYDLAIAITDQSWFGWDSSLLYTWFFGAFWTDQLNHWLGAQRDQVVKLLDSTLHSGLDMRQTVAKVEAILAEELPMAILFHRDEATAWRDDKASGVLPLQTAGLDVRPVIAKG